MATANTVVHESDIRKLYQFLRDYPKISMHREIADTISRKPIKLVEMLARSYEQCCKYDNRNEGFRQRRDDGAPTFTDARLKSNRLANRVLVSLSKLRPDDRFPFSYVDYEIRPFRVSRRPETTGAASKEGQVDVLMRTAGGAPVIGEIKARKDATLLLALIQSLASAVEFASPAQRERLSRTYPESGFALDTNHPRVGVCLLRSMPPDDKDSQAIFKAVSRISKGLMGSEIIGGITCLDIDLTDGNSFRWKKAFDHQSQS